MGPRPKARENYDLGLMSDLTDLLQWGPGQRPGKTSFKVDKTNDYNKASMGPRPKARENQQLPRLVLFCIASFNGAPAKGQGKQLALETRPHKA